jgi:hypothetical protein
MSGCPRFDAVAVELRFYDELPPAEAARFDAHLPACAACRQHLDELRTIRTALAGRRAPDAPPAGDWSGFMRRLDAAVAIPAAQPRAARPALVGWLTMAALLALVTIGVVMASRTRTAPPVRMAANQTAAPASAAGGAANEQAVARRSLVQHSEEHFERSKLVVLGLATRDPRDTRPADWAHERELADTLLPDTRLYRLAAEQRGMTGLARVMGDLETVLLETSMSDDSDPQALQRLQKLIARRDLMVKLNVIGSAGI